MGLWHVYILRCRNRSLYTGVTNDLRRRLAEHKNGRGGRFTRAFGAVKILYSEPHPDRRAAFRREAEIKSWTKEMKLALMRGKGSKTRQI